MEFFPILGHSVSLPYGQNKAIKFPLETLTSILKQLTRKSIAPMRLVIFHRVDALFELCNR